MRTRSRASGKWAAVVIALGVWGAATEVAAYAPVDELIGRVNELRAAGAIFDAATASNLVASLKAAGDTVDAGDRATGRELLWAFADEVAALGGVTITAAAADELAARAKTIAGGL